MDRSDIIAMLNPEKRGSSDYYAYKTLIGLKTEPEVFKGTSFAVEKHHINSEEYANDGYFILTALKYGKTTFWKIPTWESSDGNNEAEIENTHEVKPIQKTITVYE